MRTHITYPLALVSVLAAIFCGCRSTAPMPTSDATPPIGYWLVQHAHSRTQDQYPANQTIHVADPDTLLIMFVARDPQGLKQMRINSTGSYHCYGLPGGAYDFPPQENVFVADSEGRVPTSGVLSVRLQTHGTCDAMHPADGFVRFLGRAENFFGGSVSGYLDIHVYAP